MAGIASTSQSAYPFSSLSSSQYYPNFIQHQSNGSYSRSKSLPSSNDLNRQYAKYKNYPISSLSSTSSSLSSTFPVAEEIYRKKTVKTVHETS